MNKPRMTKLTNLTELRYLEAHSGDLDIPHVMRQGNGECFTDADELRVWRASQNTSEGAK